MASCARPQTDTDIVVSQSVITVFLGKVAKQAILSKGARERDEKRCKGFIRCRLFPILE
jgi:hypothetical protein